MNLPDLGRLLLVGAALLAVAGVVLLLLGRVGLSRLPGDFSFGSERARVYLPLGTCLLVSIVATIILNILSRR